MKLMETPTKKSNLERISIADLHVGDLVQETGGNLPRVDPLLVTDIIPLAAMDDNGDEIFSLGMRVRFLNVKSKNRHDMMYTKGTHIHRHYYLISRAE